MRHLSVKALFIATAFAIASGVSFAADSNTNAASPTAAGAKPDAKGAKSKNDGSSTTTKKGATKKSTTRVKLVDINSAGKAELKKLPGVGDAEADKIISGRPYLTKANLVTHNVISRDLYESIKKLIIAKQK